MAFFILVNGESLSLQTEMIIDDLSEEAVSKAEIETLAFMFAERFSNLSVNTLLLQGLSNTLTLAILLAAWRIGLKVALIRADAFLPNFEKSRKLLGKHLHIFYDACSEEILANHDNITCSLESWIETSPTKHLSDQPFSWDEQTTSLIFFTSGSTGIPKGVCHSLPNLIRSTKTFKKHFNLTSEDHIVSFAELHTNTGLRTLTLALFANMSVKFIRKHKGTQSHELAALKNATVMICGPYMVEVLLHMKETIKPLIHPNLKVLSLGSHLPFKIIDQFFETYQIPVFNFYGLTETFGFALADKIRNTTDYLPPPCDDVSISLSAVPNEVNLFYLEIASPNLFLGYLGEALQKKSILNTEDLVMRNEFGDLKFMGRATGAAKSKNGEWIFPLQLETWIRSHPDIQDVIVKVNPPLTTDFLLSIFITTQKNFIHLKNELSKKILALFGHDYQSISWHLANIQRTIEGKIENLVLSDEVMEDIYA